MAEIIQHLLFDQKQCRRCWQFKPCGAFYKSNANRDGLVSYCKDCTRDSVRETNQRHAAERRIKAREYHAKKPEVARAYRENNRERVRAANRKWQLANPERNAARANRYHARKYGAAGTYTDNEWLALCAKYDHRCLCCGKQGKLTVDHVVPLIKGGSNFIDNLQPLCARCNSAKGDRTIDYRDQAKIT